MRRSWQNKPIAPVHEEEDAAPPGTPFSVLLAHKKAEAAKRVQAAPLIAPQPAATRPGWSASATETGTQGSLSKRSDNKLSAKQLMRKYHSKVKPRTWMYIIFSAVSDSMRTVIPGRCSACLPHR
jgi:hypothetical protein